MLPGSWNRFRPKSFCAVRLVLLHIRYPWVQAKRKEGPGIWAWSLHVSSPLATLDGVVKLLESIMSDADDGKSDQDTGASSPPATDAPVVSIQDLRENDSELWLVRVPQHETIRSALIGKEIAVGDGHQRTSVEKSYNIVDMGRTTACSELRALFPTSSTNYAGFSCGTLSVSFDRPLS